jgi:hypothetical protein
MQRMRTVVLTSAVTAALMAAVMAPRIAPADHVPADKIVASGSGLEAFAVGSPTEGTGTNTDSRVIMSGIFRSSSPSDLVINVNLECALWTQTSTASDEAKEGVDSSETSAQVKVWVAIDDTVVPVAGDDANDTGKVVFCGRAHRMDVDFFDDDGEGDTDDQLTIKEFLRTRDSNSFQWLALNVGNGVHEIKVWGELQAAVDRFDAPFGDHSDGVTTPARAAIGKRTMIVDPGKLANDAEI